MATNVTLAEFEKAKRIKYSTYCPLFEEVWQSAIDVSYAYRKKINALQSDIDNVNNWDEKKYRFT